MKRISWCRSDDGACESKCGTWEIEPVFAGRVRPIAFSLRRDRVLVARYCNSQREAKDYAERLLEREEEAAR